MFRVAPLRRGTSVRDGPVDVATSLAGHHVLLERLAGSRNENDRGLFCLFRT